ncbi:MAG TPA: hypothetical protein VHY20_07155, partial [Pirellulales bacterium]|nr:hypothetical protein [Pirellulales bacterium]
ALAAKLPGAMLAIDAGQLKGIALQLAGHAEESAKALQQTAQLASRQDLHQAAYLLLLESDAERIAEQYPAAVESWQSAAELAGEWTARPIAVCDPVFWERAAYLKPVKISWPERVQQRLAQAAQLPARQAAASPAAAPAEAECVLFACLGQWRLDRDEPQTALLDFKRAETNTADSAYQDFLQQAQAKALSRLQQSGAATAILMNLAHKPDPATAHSAMALLGSLKLESGQLEFGFKMLQRALEQQPIVDWPTRGESEADLGLAYLMLGDEAAGLRWLHQAQQRFEAEGRIELLAKSLRNELGYWNHKGKHKDEIEAINKRLQDLEDGSGSTAKWSPPAHKPSAVKAITRLPAQ